MGRYGTGGSGQLHLVGSTGHDAVSGLYARADFHPLSVIGAQLYGLLLVALLVQLAVHKVAALLLGQGSVGQGNDVFLWGAQQVDFNVCAGQDGFPLGHAELEGDGHTISALRPRGLAVGQQAAAQPVMKLIASAAANATNNFDLDGDLLYISEIQASDGIKMRRYLPRAKGSSSGMVRRTANIRVTVKERK